MVVVSCSLATTLGYIGIVKPLTKIIEQTHCIGSYDLSKISKVSSRIREIHNLSDSLVFMASGLRSFGKYIPTELVKKLLKSGLVAEPYGENRTISVLFADLVGFTSITEVLGPKIVPHLDRYFETMSEQIEAQLGTIDKFIGDCVMAFWGAPYYFEEHPVRACVAALNCLEKLEELRKQWPEQWSADLGMRIGVNTGRVVVGNIGSKSRINYTVVGDPVNLASRLESGCKIYGVRCIIGQSTYELAKYDIVARRLDVTHFKGKAEPVVIYELIAMRGKTEVALDYPWIEVYDKALTAFLAGDMVAAKTHFELTIQMRGEDPPSRFFLQRCNQGLSLV
jgi:adenylate cyclase